MPGATFYEKAITGACHDTKGLRDFVEQLGYMHPYNNSWFFFISVHLHVHSLYQELWG